MKSIVLLGGAFTIGAIGADYGMSFVGIGALGFIWGLLISSLFD